jgi:hypothetical protein
MTKEKFTISIPNDTLKDLRDRLTRTRFAPDFGNSRWEYGTNGDYLKELIDYWRDKFDWRKPEAISPQWRNPKPSSTRSARFSAPYTPRAN